MFSAKQIAVVIPVYNEATHIKNVINTVPDYVNYIIVIDDSSTDQTTEILAGIENSKLTVINHAQNMGVGSAIISGYKKSLELKADIVAVMGGDGQMDPEELCTLIEPVASNEADYVKGNRFICGKAFKAMPLIRYIGNVSLSYINKPISGYWHIFDSQCGYTAISRKMLKLLPLDNIYPRYGVPNDILSHLGLSGARVLDRPVTPIYHRKHSHMNMLSLPFTLGSLLLRISFRRFSSKLDRPKTQIDEATDATR